MIYIYYNKGGIYNKIRKTQYFQLKISTQDGLRIVFKSLIQQYTF